MPSRHTAMVTLHRRMAAERFDRRSGQVLLCAFAGIDCYPELGAGEAECQDKLEASVNVA